LKEQGILSDLRVLDLCDEKGWLCSKLLAGMGAEVIRVQSPRLPIPDCYANRGKHSLSLKIESKKGADLFLQLVKTADILIETFPPGYLEGLGLDYVKLRDIKPRLIMVSITPFGQTGPYRDFKTSELVSAAMGGQMSVTGDPEKAPLKPYGPQTFWMASLFAANGVMLALRERESGGSGQYLDISIHECTAGTLDHVMVRYFNLGEVAQRSGSLNWNQAFRIFKCQDGYILLTLFYQWQTLMELLKSEGGAGELGDEVWSGETYRRENAEKVIQVLEEWTQKHKVDELVELGQLMRFPWAAVDDLARVLDNPQLRSRSYFVEQKDPGSGRTIKVPGAPVKMSRSPWKVDQTLPRSGEYNQQIYGRELGLSEEEIASLEAEGVI
jgi:benzylsuccinate CoA-transferase BbsE subunit